MIPDELLADLRAVLEKHKVRLSIFTCLYKFDTDEDKNVVAKYGTVIFSNWTYRDEAGENRARQSANLVFVKLCQDLEIMERGTRY